MSYNGVGLSTPRGSESLLSLSYAGCSSSVLMLLTAGTNGYIMSNFAHLRPRDNPLRSGGIEESWKTGSEVRHRQPDAAILDHERKRKIEVACLELEDKLDGQGVAEEEIERQVTELRDRLQRQGTAASRSRADIKSYVRLIHLSQLISHDSHSHETHELAAIKAKENQKMATAFGIKGDHKEGYAFDREAQAERVAKEKEDRELRKVAMEQERAETQARRAELNAQAVRPLSSPVSPRSDPVPRNLASRKRSTRSASVMPSEKLTRALFPPLVRPHPNLEGAAPSHQSPLACVDQAVQRPLFVEVALPLAQAAHRPCRDPLLHLLASDRARLLRVVEAGPLLDAATLALLPLDDAWPRVRLRPVDEPPLAPGRRRHRLGEGTRRHQDVETRRQGDATLRLVAVGTHLLPVEMYEQVARDPKPCPFLLKTRVVQYKCCSRDILARSRSSHRRLASATTDFSSPLSPARLFTLELRLFRFRRAAFPHTNA